MSLDLFLSGAKSQLQSLMSTTPITTPLNVTRPTTGVTSSANNEMSFDDGTKNAPSSTTSPNMADDSFNTNGFDPTSSTVTSDNTTFTTSTNFDEF